MYGVVISFLNTERSILLNKLGLRKFFRSPSLLVLNSDLFADRKFLNCV